MSRHGHLKAREATEFTVNSMANWHPLGHILSCTGGEPRYLAKQKTAGNPNWQGLTEAKVGCCTDGEEGTAFEINHCDGFEVCFAVSEFFFCFLFASSKFNRAKVRNEAKCDGSNTTFNEIDFQIVPFR